MLSIGFLNQYPGWNNFSREIKYLYDILFELEITKSIDRIGLRYINFFDFNIFPFLKLKIELYDSEIDPKNAVFRTEIIKENFKNTLQIANNATFNRQVGSVIDIDCFRDLNNVSSLDEVLSLFDKMHRLEKKLFFELLQDSLVKKLKPSYQ